MSVLIILSCIALMLLFLSFVLFIIIFYAPPRKNADPNVIAVPEGKIYEPFWEDMRKWVREARKLPQEQFSIISYDGLKLYGKYYEFAPGAPIELMFHGYRGNAERDLSGGVQRCFQLGRSALIVDQRCSGLSEGNVITFGIREHKDCLAWIEFMVSHFGTDVKIILTGISMGASTVLIAAGQELPDNVVGVLADCGFNSAKDIIKSVASNLGLPATVLYPFAKLGAKIFGGFDLESYSPETAVKDCKVPVIFFHGLDDDYVPYSMSQINYDLCPTRKQLVLVPGAGHGLSFPVSPDLYLKEAGCFFTEEISCSLS